MTIILGLLSLSGLRTECSFMRTMIPGALIAGASAYVGGLYYYRRLDSMMRKTIDLRQDYARKVASAAQATHCTSYQELTCNIMAITKCLPKNGMNRFQKTIFRMFGGDEDTLHNNMVNNIKQTVCNMIDNFFERRIKALQSFHEKRSHDQAPKRWRDFYKDPKENSLQSLQTVLKQAFPNISDTYVNDRYQQHLREAHLLYELTQRPARTAPETEMCRKWGLTNYKHDPKRVRILIFSCHLPSDDESMETNRLWNRVKPHIATVPLYEKTPNANDGYYITLQDIAQCLKLSNPQQYEYLANLSYCDRASYRTSRAIQNFNGMFPFRIRNATIQFNKEMLPKPYDIQTQPPQRYDHNGGVRDADGLTKLPIFINDYEEYTYAVNIYPFDISSNQQFRASSKL
jgi:hypothetical protein